MLVNNGCTCVWKVQYLCEKKKQQQKPKEVEGREVFEEQIGVEVG